MHGIRKLWDFVPLRYKILLSTSPALVGLCLFGVAGMLISTNALRTDQKVWQALEIERELDLVRQTSAAPESDLRGWLLTGDSQFLKSYFPSLEKARTEASNLLRIAKNSPLQGQAEAVAQLVKLRIDALERVRLLGVSAGSREKREAVRRTLFFEGRLTLSALKLKLDKMRPPANLILLRKRAKRQGVLVISALNGLGILAALFTACYLSTLIASGIAQRVNELIHVFSSLAAGETVAAVPARPGNDEIGDLARALLYAARLIEEKTLMLEMPGKAFRFLMKRAVTFLPIAPMLLFAAANRRR